MKTKMSGKLTFSFFFCQVAIIVLTSLICTLPVESQQNYVISGKLINSKGDEAIAFANIALLDTTESFIIGGAASNETGHFIISEVLPGKYNIRISALGYETVSENKIIDAGDLYLGSILMTEITINLDDVEITANRIMAKQEPNNTTYFINHKMKASTNLGTDILKLLPGVGIDFQHNITLDGSQNLILLVDGMERDLSYLRQLPASKIDKVEIISSPPAKYDASVTGIINVILIKKPNAGVDGQIYFEIPTSSSEIFLTPVYNFNYSTGKFNIYTSYNGDYRRLQITESYHRTIHNTSDANEFISIQALTQKTWSHRFHYGFDWFLNDRNHLNLYGYFNPYSQELDGITQMQVPNDDSLNWKSTKDDNDTNSGTFYSLWYKHLFNKTTGHEITLESSIYSLSAQNTTTYTEPNGNIFSQNKIEPDNQIFTTKLDYNLPLSKSIRVNSGFYVGFRKFQDKNNLAFNYNNIVYAGYGTLNYSREKLEAMLGLRIEHTTQKNIEPNSYSWWLLLPDALIRYKCGTAGSLGLNLRRSVSYPGFYQLNSQISINDPFSINAGNPNLHPELITQAHLEYNQSFKNNFLSARLFFHHASDAIRNLYILNEANQVVSQKHNLGDIYKYGLQVNGSLGFGKVGINPSIKVFNSYSVPNTFARAYHIKDRHHFVLESGLSAYITFKKGFMASASLQYTSPVNEIQEYTFSDALYFISVGKTFSKGLKAGVVSGIPFARNFTYQGTDITNKGFSHFSKGKLNMSTIPFWLTLSYQFSSGKKNQAIKRDKAAPDPEKRKGF